MLTQENDSGFRRHNPYAARGLNAADPRQADVQEDDRRLKFLGLLHGLFAIRTFSYDIEIGITGENGSNSPSRDLMIINQEHTNSGHFQRFHCECNFLESARHREFQTPKST